MRSPALSLAVLVTTALMLIPFVGVWRRRLRGGRPREAPCNLSPSPISRGDNRGDNKGNNQSNNQGHNNNQGNNQGDNRGEHGDGKGEHGDGHHGRTDDDEYHHGKQCDRRRPVQTGQGLWRQESTFTRFGRTSQVGP